MNYDEIPDIFELIVESAFGLEQFAGGSLGVTMMVGIKRGLFSNEAGEGSAPNVAATAHVSHPVKQGLVQALGVYTDTLLVCSCTAFIILISGLYTDPSLNGIALTQSALNSEIGSTGTIFVAIGVVLLDLFDFHRRTNTGNDVFALRVHQHFRVEMVFTGRGVTGKGYA